MLPGLPAWVSWVGPDGNLGDLTYRAHFTGYQIDGGYATHCIADARYVYALPENYGDLDVAPLLCAGLIGYRALRMCGDAHRVGIYGFGSAAHVITQVALWEGREVLAFTRRGDAQAQAFARSLGAAWAGASDEAPAQALDAAIIFASAGDLVPAALRAVRKGGVVVCGGIHMSDIPPLPYELLWGERTLKSVANLTRTDGEDVQRAIAQARWDATRFTAMSPVPTSPQRSFFMV